MVPELAARPDPVDFSNAELGLQGPEAPVTLENIGLANVRITGISVEGDGSSHVAIDEGSMVRSLDPGVRTDLRLRLVDIGPTFAEESAELVIEYRGYAGLGERGTTRLPLALSVPDACDGDGDGYLALSCGGDDCNDDETVTHPGAPERCNSFDDDCDGLIDEVEDVEDPLTFFADSDGDGYGGPEVILACFPGPGRTEFTSDCDDTDATISPVGVERCDGIDNDCDGAVDGQEAINAVTFNVDFDGDGFGDPENAVTGCVVPEGFVLNDLDCDDLDGDRSPAAEEVCDGTDQNCNGQIDEFALDTVFWFPDADGDGYGPSGSAQRSCSPPSSSASLGGDCDDGNADVNPEGFETCNGIDDDCDGLLDENGDGDRSTFWRDADGDSFGNPADRAEACGNPDGYVVNDQDCDDANADNFPNNEEFCDGGDNNCDGDIDEGLTCEEVCGNGIDDDGNGRTDCEDPACFGDDTCFEDCSNGLDDDLDGLPDCADPDCANDGSCVEDCTNNTDDDGDGEVDCEDSDCAQDPSCASDVEDCGNGIDDNGDGRIDCEDPICDFAPECLFDTEVDCSNNIDDDGDGAVDCNDSDCAFRPECNGPTEVACSNGLDDDADGDIDCDDSDCVDSDECVDSEEICGNGIDDDNNGLVDCEDSNCFEAPGCFEDCTNGIDDDNNGLADCNDPACIDECAGDVSVQVTGGRMRIETKDEGNREVCDALLITVEKRNSFLTRTLRAYDVQGIATRTADDGQEVTCNWSVQSASAAYDRRFSSSFLDVGEPEVRLGAVRRVGFQIEPPCDDLDASILPQFLFPLPDEALLAEAPLNGQFFPESQLTIGQEWYTGLGTQIDAFQDIQVGTTTQSFQGFQLTCDTTDRLITEEWDVELEDGTPSP